MGSPGDRAPKSAHQRCNRQVEGVREWFQPFCLGCPVLPCPTRPDDVGARRSTASAGYLHRPRYLVYLATHGAKVPTMSRRLSSIAYAHRFAGVTNPVEALG